MKRTTLPILPSLVDRAPKSLSEAAARKTCLCQADLLRSASRVGGPEVVYRQAPRSSPRRPLVEYFDAFAGLTKSNRELVAPPRFK
jgi:hypothetical protein